MPIYKYQALTASGEAIPGEFHAESREDVLEYLQKQKLLPIEVDVKANTPWWSLQVKDVFSSAPKSLELHLFSKQLARLIKSGLELDRATQLLAELAKDRKWQLVIHDIHGDIRRGKSFSAAISHKKHIFPQDYVNLIRAGESSGGIIPSLERLADLFKRRAMIKQRVASALIYPAILFIMAICSVSLILTVVLPQFEPLFADSQAELPLPTLVVIAASHFLRDFWWIGACLVIGAVFLWNYIKRSPELLLSRDKWLLETPLAGTLLLYSDVIHLTRTLGTLMQSGIVLGDGLPIVCNGIKNHYLQKKMVSVADAIRSGEDFSALLTKENCFPKLMLSMTRIGQESGKLDEMLLEVAGIYEDEVQQSIDRMLTLLVPLLTIVMGLVVAFLVSAMLLAMLSINNLAL